MAVICINVLSQQRKLETEASICAIVKIWRAGVLADPLVAMVREEVKSAMRQPL